jgi:hypothetical protein
VYLSLDGVLRSALSGRRQELLIWLWAVFIVIGVGNVLYLKQTSNVTDFAQYAILTSAYVVWVLTMGGPFALYQWYERFMGSVILALFTFIVPVVYKGVVTDAQTTTHSN